MAELALQNLSIVYGGVTAVDDVSLTVKDGEFLTLLGPSGCGKSTTLFSIAGLIPPSAGSIRMGETVFFDAAGGSFMPPERRNIGLVFQSYALWPHKTVAENLAFPLTLRKIGKTEQTARIKDALNLVEMSVYAARYPFELSGGQQQRVALARALVYRPGLLLLDEPLSNLDAKLRERARVWLRELQERLKVTTIYVTHDQAEALAVSDRVAVMNMGRLRQLGAPQEIYDRPVDAFVADFIGSSNFLSGQVLERNGKWASVRLADGAIIRAGTGPQAINGNVVVAVRPERILLVDRPGENTLQVHVETSAYLGSVYHYELANKDLRFRIQTEGSLADGDVFVRIPPEAATIFPSRHDEQP